MSRFTKKLAVFWVRTIWADRLGAHWLLRAGNKVLRALYLVANAFLDHKCFIRSSALAYTTLLSIVPLLAFAFAILKGVGTEGEVRQYVQAVMEKVAAGQPEVSSRLTDYVANYVTGTSVKALGALGLITLLWTVVKVLSTVEATFNDIWGVAVGRAWLRKIADYTSVMVIAPVLLVAAMAMSTYLSMNPLAGYVPLGDLIARGAAKVGPYVLTWAAFTAFYAFMPNTKVHFTPAVVGGVAGGTLWQAAFWGYTKFQIGAAKYNIVYTSFAALPVFLVWLYLSWVILLVGAEIAFVSEHFKARRPSARFFKPSHEGRERMGLRIFLEIAHAFHKGAAPPTADALSRIVRVPIQAVSDILRVLAGAGFVSEVVLEDAVAYQPGRDISTVTASQVLAAIRADGEKVDGPKDDPLWEETLRLAEAACGSLSGGDLGKSVAEIVSRMK